MIGALLCRLGWHDPEPQGRWNGGYCFTHCRACRRDMVRSAFGEWHVPDGFKVVWKPEGSFDDLDRVMAARDGSAVAPPPVEIASEPVDVVDPPEPPPPAVEPAADKEANRSPFDFGDFEESPMPRPLPPVPELRRRR